MEENLLIFDGEYVDNLYYRLLQITSLVEFLWLDVQDDKYSDVLYGIALQLKYLNEEFRGKYSEAETLTFRNTNLLKGVRA